MRYIRPWNVTGALTTWLCIGCVVPDGEPMSNAPSAADKKAYTCCACAKGPRQVDAEECKAVLQERTCNRLPAIIVDKHELAAAGGWEAEVATWAAYNACQALLVAHADHSMPMNLGLRVDMAASVLESVGGRVARAQLANTMSATPLPRYTVTLYDLGCALMALPDTIGPELARLGDNLKAAVRKTGLGRATLNIIGNQTLSYLTWPGGQTPMILTAATDGETGVQTNVTPGPCGVVEGAYCFPENDGHAPMYCLDPQSQVISLECCWGAIRHRSWAPTGFRLQRTGGMCPLAPCKDLDGRECQSTAAHGLACAADQGVGFAYCHQKWTGASSSWRFTLRLQDGQVCQRDADCESGICRWSWLRGESNWICQPQQCRPLAQECVNDDDCCSGLCQYEAPPSGFWWPSPEELRQRRGHCAARNPDRLGARCTIIPACVGGRCPISGTCSPTRTCQLRAEFTDADAPCCVPSGEQARQDQPWRCCPGSRMDSHGWCRLDWDGSQRDRQLAPERYQY
jgi:hypothetical protein